MIRVIAIGGEPATGKSTLMKALIALLGAPNPERKAGLVRYQAYPEQRVIILGSYAAGERFPGTDRLPMNVQPEAEAFIARLQSDPRWDGATVLFEGDRLFNNKFLRAIKDSGAFLQVVCVNARSESLAARHRARADSQTETWLKGRRTKVHNVCKEFIPDILLPHNSPEETAQAVDLLRRLIGSNPINPEVLPNG